MKDHPPKTFHPAARGKKLFNAQVTSPDFQKLMQIMGKKQMGSGGKPIEIVIYNDVKSKKGTFYAKFIEYGWMGVNPRWGAYWHPGKRLYASLRKWIKRRIIANYKLMAHRGNEGYFTRSTVVNALSQTAEETVDRLKQITPEDTGEMKKHWKWFVR